MIILKKILARCFFPVTIFFILLLIASWCILTGKPGSRRLKIGKILLIIALVFMFIGSFGGKILTYYHERNYPPLNLNVLQSDRESEYIICIYGASFYQSETYPPECLFNDAMLLRLWEGGRIGRYCQDNQIKYKIAVSVAGDSPVEKKIAAVQSYFNLFDIPMENVVIIQGALNTRQETLTFGKFGSKLILVSQSFHIPRINALAKKYELAAMLAPVGNRDEDFYFGVLDLFPTAESIYDVKILVYEWLGRLEYNLLPNAAPGAIHKKTEHH